MQVILMSNENCFASSRYRSVIYSAIALLALILAIQPVSTLPTPIAEQRKVSLLSLSDRQVEPRSSNPSEALFGFWNSGIFGNRPMGQLRISSITFLETLEMRKEARIEFKVKPHLHHYWSQLRSLLRSPETVTMNVSPLELIKNATIRQYLRIEASMFEGPLTSSGLPIAEQSFIAEVANVYMALYCQVDRAILSESKRFDAAFAFPHSLLTLPDQHFVISVINSATSELQGDLMVIEGIILDLIRGMLVARAAAQMKRPDAAIVSPTIARQRTLEDCELGSLPDRVACLAASEVQSSVASAGCKEDLRDSQQTLSSTLRASTGFELVEAPSLKSLSQLNVAPRTLQNGETVADKPLTGDDGNKSCEATNEKASYNDNDNSPASVDGLHELGSSEDSRVGSLEKTSNLVLAHDVKRLMSQTALKVKNLVKAIA